MQGRHATVVAYLALIVALSGSAYAVATIKSSDIANNTIRRADVRDDDLKGGGLVGKDIKESRLKGVDADKLDGLDATEFALAQSEAWHDVGGLGEPAFHGDGWNCEWRNAPFSGYPSAAFSRDSSGFVHFRGLVDNETPGGASCEAWATAEKIFTLPEGYRPAGRAIFAVVSHSQLGRITVRPDGIVELGADVASSWNNADMWISLDGVTFRAEQ